MLHLALTTWMIPRNCSVATILHLLALGFGLVPRRTLDPTRRFVVISTVYSN
jgi:hypothetical protein